MQALGISPFGLIAYGINFIVLVVVLRLVLYKPVKEMLARRQERIAEGLEAAERAAAEAAEQRAAFERELETARQEAQAEAKRLADQTERMRADVLEAAEREAEQLKARAREEIEQERQRAVSDLQRETADLALAIARKVVGAAVDEAAQRRLVQQFVDELPGS